MLPVWVEKAYHVPERDCARQGSGKLLGMAGPWAREDRASRDDNSKPESEKMEDRREAMMMQVR